MRRRRASIGSSTSCSGRARPSTSIGAPSPHGRSVEYRLANNLVRNAALGAPDDPAIQTLWGELFGEKYNQLEASKSFTEALALDDQWAAGPSGDGTCPGRHESAERPCPPRGGHSRSIPDYLESHLFLAQRDLDDRDQTEAHVWLDRALAINDQSLEARSLVAAVAYVEDRLTTSR